MVESEVTRIAGLYVYPIKSCRGVPVASSNVLKEGLEFDRRFMFVDAKTRKFLTIRENSGMTLIRPALHLEGADPTLSITIRDRDAEPVTVPARPGATYLAGLEVADVEIWGVSVRAHLFPPETSACVSAFLEREVRLVYHAPEITGVRTLIGNGSLARLGRDGGVGFADVSPLQLSSLASLDELNDRLRGRGKETITVERFRPNIVVEGRTPWDEDTWSVISLLGDFEGKIVVDCIDRCARCLVPNVEPESALKHAKEPWETLMRSVLFHPSHHQPRCFLSFILADACI